ncbi:MAG: hypothetical protein JOZ51_17115 [Chloroflexi bacterium]|nr:hypothetical protein [Chloroflexota bacterium]
MQHLSAPRTLWHGLTRVSSMLLLSSLLVACASRTSTSSRSSQAALIPPNASDVFIDDSASPGAQKITFVTDQSAQVILDFYRAELPQHGWSWGCSTTHIKSVQGPCDSNITLRDEDAHDVYYRTEGRYRRGPTFEVIIKQETPPQTFVEVYDQWAYANR